MPYTYTLTTVIPATPEAIYEAWLDSVGHSEMTGGDAAISDEVGAEFSAWDEYITGRNLELVPGQRIVQSWRTSEFADEHADSVVTMMLEPVEEGTLLTLVHSNVPDEHRSYEEGGWESNYFEPMKVYFAKLERDEATEGPEMPEPSSPEPAPPETRPAAPAPRQTRKAKTKRTAPKAKAATAKKKKTKRAAPAKSKRKTAKPSAKKSAKKSARKPATPKARKSLARPRAHR